MACAAVLALCRPPAAAAAADRLPDLGMARLRDLSIDTATLPGRRLLRFSTVIVNVGDGPFALDAKVRATITASPLVI